jgi:hypothetical protein
MISDKRVGIWWLWKDYYDLLNTSSACGGEIHFILFQHRMGAIHLKLFNAFVAGNYGR